jgi:undecaprenyl-diphosphatase
MNSPYVTFVFLGVVQGIAEFLPVSSSGHLVIMENLPLFRDSLKVISPETGVFIAVMLHLATLLAVCVFMWKDIWYIIKGSALALWTRNLSRHELRATLFILCATIPAGIVGYVFKDFFEGLFASPLATCFLLILNGAILLSTKIISPGVRKLEETGSYRSIGVGFCQAFAILPGISRSGMTITGSLLAGLRPEEAARFSFLMAIPVIAGSGLLELLKAGRAPLAGELIAPLCIALAVCFIVAMVSLKLLFFLVKKVRIDIFGYYTIAAGLAGAAYFLSI